MTNRSFTLNTDHGLISVTDTSLRNDAPALLLIHGNSSSSKIWRHIQDSKRITERWRVVAFDLPGHGASSNAPDPETSYSMRGYAELATHILDHLNIKSVVVLGWSLGGHVGIEMVPLLKECGIALKGLMIIGTPPALGIEQINHGFSFEDPHMGLPGRKDWTDEEAEQFARTSAGEPFEQWMEDCAKRTDGRARLLMFKKFAEGVGLDQRKMVEENGDVLVAVVNGGAEPYINLDYLDEIKWKNLWKGRCVRLEGLKHAPFWEKPEAFAEVLKEFLGGCEKV
ncbi:alpha/beta-hydrolase [Lentithecium fluviatile CBS 122367]|uniref:Alpha/beta-hydrolase n=1 Tax=Lentithecium fluviatile CBS 122367 TaxID=1168545 RepID=A0A6G1ICX9_9PLEO|nr:alpha/beta-hydrolase [Lentithecium fluviatile CBS 122367]